jgi:hypothetical protein
LARTSHLRLEHATVALPESQGGELRAELAKVALIAAPQLGILFSPSFELGLATRPHKDLPLSHHRHQQSPFDSYERRLAIGLCAGRCGTSGNWLPEYQAAAHDSVSRPVLRKSICRRVCAVLLAGVNYFFRWRLSFLPVLSLHHWSTIAQSDAEGVRSSVSEIC